MAAPRKCDGCESEATVWCDECAQAICAGCLVWHAKFNPQHDIQAFECGGDRSDNDGDGDITAAVRLGGSGAGGDKENSAGIAHALEGARIGNDGRDDDGGSGWGGYGNKEVKTFVESGPTESGPASVVSSIAVVGRGGSGDDEWLQCCACSQPLRDPVQLQCLHNCCKSCLKTIALVKDGQEVKDGSGADAAAAAAAQMRPPPAKVHCPICNEACRTTVGRVTDVLNANAFVARLAAQQQRDTIGGDAQPPAGDTAAPEPLPRCDVCAEDEQSVDAQMWCAACSQALCSNCVHWHGKFNPRHAVTALGDGGASPSAATRSPPVEAAAASRAVDAAAGDDVVRCPLHAASPYEFECAQCGSLKCAECLKACVDRKHAVALATDPREYVRRTAERLRGAQLALESAAGALSVNGDYERLLGGGGELAAAQAADARRLAMSRELALAELQRTYAAAERALSEAYAEARERAAAALGAVGAVRAGAELARSYCERLLGTGDPGSVAQQQAVLLARMRALKKRAEAMLESPVPAAEDWVGLEAEKSADFLAGALRKWLGMASLRDGLVARLDASCGGGGDNEEDVDSGDNESDSESRGGELDVLRFERGAAGPAAAAECVDVAITADGHLLLAVIGEPNARGLVEYDAGGAELRRWRPPRPGGSGQHDFVCSVAALDDGRVAAGVLNAQAVQLLRRGPAADSWVRDRLIAVQLLPRRLSICGDALAVASGRLSSPPSNGGGFPDVLPGSSLAVLPNAAAAEAAAAPPSTEPRDLGYNVLALALTARALVVTSADRLEQPPHGGGSSLSPSYAVLALDRAALTVLWRYASDEPVAVVCAHGGALYLFGRDNGAVLAIDARRGKKVAIEVLRLGAVADDAAARKAPAATAAAPLSASLRVVTAAGGRDRLPSLAVLFADRRTTRVYPSADPAA